MSDSEIAADRRDINISTATTPMVGTEAGESFTGIAAVTNKT